MVINIEILYRNIKMHMEVKAVLLNDMDSIHTWLIHIVYMSFLHDAIFNVSLMCVFMEHDVRLYHSWTFTSKVICLQNGAKKKTIMGFYQKIPTGMQENCSHCLTTFQQRAYT